MTARPLSFSGSRINSHAAAAMMKASDRGSVKKMLKSSFDIVSTRRMLFSIIGSNTSANTSDWIIIF